MTGVGISSGSKRIMGTTAAAAGTNGRVVVDMVKNIFGRMGNSVIGIGLIDSLEEVGSRFESTTHQLKKGVVAVVGT